MSSDYWEKEDYIPPTLYYFIIKDINGHYKIKSTDVKKNGIEYFESRTQALKVKKSLTQTKQ